MAYNEADVEGGKYPPSYAASDDGVDMTGFSNKAIRRGFIRKVYAVLASQLLVTFGIVAVFCFVQQVSDYVLRNSWTVWTALALNLVLFIVLVCVPGVRRQHPWNLICLMGFTVCEGFMLGAVASTYSTNSVLQAVAYTAIIVICLTLFAFQTKIDFTLCSGVMFVVLICLLVVGLSAAIFRNHYLDMVYAGLGALVFSVYIVIDTQLLMGTHQLSISPEEYVFAALNIYLDIINLFMYLLTLVSGGGD